MLPPSPLLLLLRQTRLIAPQTRLLRAARLPTFRRTFHFTPARHQNPESTPPSSTISDGVEPAVKLSELVETENVETFEAEEERIDLPPRDSEDFVRVVKDYYGHNLPTDLLTEKEMEIYTRSYGPPVRFLSEEEVEEIELKAAEKFAEMEEALEAGNLLFDAEGNVVRTKGEGEEDVEGPVENDIPEGEWSRPGEEGEVFVDAGDAEQLQMLQQIQRDIERSQQRPQSVEEHRGETFDLAADAEEVIGNPDEPEWMRAHPLTRLGHFAPRPATILSPPHIKDTTAALLTDVSNKHLQSACDHNFGAKLKESPIMTHGCSKKSGHIPLPVHDAHMSEMESSAFITAVLPGYYAQSLSVLTEIRRRLGREWVLGGGKEKGVVNVLDLGSGGAATIAWKDIVKAQKEVRADEIAAETGIPRSEEAPPTAEEQAAPGGVKATVHVASDPLRRRMSKYLENTTFIPRIPDRVPEMEINEKQPRKLYDLIISTNSFIGMTHNHKRKELLETMWSLLNPKGGVLVIVEKGNVAGFEAVGGAREHVLSNFIYPPHDVKTGFPSEGPRMENGHIVAPCTNHTACPLYTGEQPITNRRDYCRFPVRYERPGYMQRILNATSRNHEDLEYSFVSFRRGVPLRTNLPSKAPKPEDFITNPDGSAAPHATTPHSIEALRAHTLSLPRIIFPPIKNHGHVIIDLCAPSGKIERWTVPKSYGKLAFRDARKAQWGDLWALGAKTKIFRNISVGPKINPLEARDAKNKAENRKKFEKKIRKIEVSKKDWYDEGTVKESMITKDAPGGRKANPGKRKKERMEHNRMGKEALIKKPHDMEKSWERKKMKEAQEDRVEDWEEGKEIREILKDPKARKRLEKVAPMGALPKENYDPEFEREYEAWLKKEQAKGRI